MSIVTAAEEQVLSKYKALERKEDALRVRLQTMDVNSPDFMTVLNQLNELSSRMSMFRHMYPRLLN